MDALILPQNKPYYAVIFTSIRSAGDNGYSKTGEEIIAIVSQQQGYLGAESVRDTDGVGITVSYWDSLESIRAWRKNISHARAMQAGKDTWYAKYAIRICQVLRDNYFSSMSDEI